MKESIEFLERWQENGRMLKVELNDGRTTTGVIEGVDERGVVLTDCADGRVYFISYNAIKLVEGSLDGL